MSTWDTLLGNDRERVLRDELERTWGRLVEAARASVARLERARGGSDESLDLLQTVWAVHHALDGGVVVGGSRIGLILHAATRGEDAELLRARHLAARAARVLARSRVMAVLERGWAAVALPEGRFLATDAEDGDLRPLTALLVAARPHGKETRT